MPRSDDDPVPRPPPRLAVITAPTRLHRTWTWPRRSPTLLGSHGRPTGARSSHCRCADRSRVRSAALIERCRADTRGQALCSGTSFDGDSTWPSGYEGVVTERFKYVEYDDGTRQLIDSEEGPKRTRQPHRSSSVPPDGHSAACATPSVDGNECPDDDRHRTAGRSSSKSPVFTYFSPSRFSTYRCRLTQDGKSPAWHPCGAEGETLGPLADGHYTFAVAGTDENGRVDPTPASRLFTITSSGPHVEITAHPPSVQVGSSARFVVSQLGRSSRVLCRLAPAGTGGPWTSCDQLTFDGLPDGDWLFEAMAQDADTGSGPRLRRHGRSEWMRRARRSCSRSAPTRQRGRRLLDSRSHRARSRRDAGHVRWTGGFPSPARTVTSRSLGSVPATIGWW